MPLHNKELVLAREYGGYIPWQPDFVILMYQDEFYKTFVNQDTRPRKLLIDRCESLRLSANFCKSENLVLLSTRSRNKTLPFELIISANIIVRLEKNKIIYVKDRTRVHDQKLNQEKVKQVFQADLETWFQKSMINTQS